MGFKPFVRFILLFTLCLVPYIRAEEKSKETESKTDEVVVTLTKDTFDEFVQKNQFTVVEFYAPWCGHCKRLQPEYEAAAKALKEDGIPLAKIDATVDTELANKYEVSGYPTLKAFRKGKPEEYKGGRTKDTIVEWVRRMTGPALEEVDTAAAAEKLSFNQTVAFIGKFKSKDSSAFKLYSAVAEERRDAGKLIAIISKSEGDDTVTAVRPVEGKSDVHKISKEEDLKKYIDTEKFPLFGPISASNYADYFQADRDIVWFAGTSSQYESSGKVIREVAKETREKHLFVWLNVEEFKDHAESALGVLRFPSLLVQQKESRYLYDSNQFNDAKKVVKFIDEVHAGKVKRHLISEELPEKNDEPIKIIVGKSFNDMVLQKDKDVLLEVYAPWCGHCKQLEPIYLEFAKSMQNVEHLLIAKMDGTKNESPNTKFQWGGFPTLFYVKAGTEEPIMYTGERSVEGLTKFVREHSSKPLSPEESKDEL